MRTSLIFLTSAALLCSACTQTDAIRPEELPRLRGASTQVVGHSTYTDRVGAYPATHTTRLVQSTVLEVAREDGRVMQVVGPYSVVLTRKEGTAETFEHPVESFIDAGVLHVRGANLADTAFQLSAVKSVEVVQADNGATELLCLMGGLLVAGVLIQAL